MHTLTWTICVLTISSYRSLETPSQWWLWSSMWPRDKVVLFGLLEREKGPLISQKSGKSWWQFNKNTCSLCERIFEDHTWVLNWDWGQRMGINCKLSETVKFKNRVESCTIMRIYPTIEWKVSHHIWKISTAFFFSLQREDDHILNISKYRSQHFDLHKRKSIYKPARLLRHCYERLWTFWQDDRSWAWKLSGLQGNHSFINFFRSS